MLEGHCLLADEISLAEDSVLERINSVLETERVLVVPERPPTGSKQEQVEGAEIVAHEK